MTIFIVLFLKQGLIASCQAIKLPHTADLNKTVGQYVSQSLKPHALNLAYCAFVLLSYWVD